MKKDRKQSTGAKKTPIVKPVRREFRWKDVLEDLRRDIASNAAIKRSLEKLIAAGCDETLILKKLYLYCGGTKEEQASAKKQFRYQLNFIRKLSKHLKDNVVPRIKTAQSYMKDRGFDVNFFDPEEIRAALDHWGNVAFKDVASKRTGGRDHHLLFLSMYVKMITGGARHQAIADLVVFLSGGESAGSPDAVSKRGESASTPDAIRKLIERTPMDLGSYEQLQSLATNEEQHRLLRDDFNERSRRILLKS